MKILLLVLSALSIAVLASCDMRSETAKKEMEKFSGTPTPIPSPTPTEIPIDPADIVAVDINSEGDRISINADSQTKTAACPEFNSILINGNSNMITIKGPCRQVMVNGDNNEINADAAMEVVFNGSGNTVKYTRFPNGKRPSVTENQAGNQVEKVSADSATRKARISTKP